MTHSVVSRRQMLAETAAVVALSRLAPGWARPSRPHHPPSSSGNAMDIVVRDSGAGLASITEVRITNGMVDVPPFTPGTTGPVVVTARKTDPKKPTSWSFVTVDVAGKRKRWA